MWAGRGYDYSALCVRGQSERKREKRKRKDNKHSQINRLHGKCLVFINDDAVSLIYCDYLRNKTMKNKE